MSKRKIDKNLAYEIKDSLCYNSTKKVSELFGISETTVFRIKQNNSPYQDIRLDNPPTELDILDQHKLHDNEIWKKVPSELINEYYKHDYYVSNYGRVWSARGKKILKQKIKKEGYCVLNLYSGDNPFYVHRLVLGTFEPVRDIIDLFVNHINATKNDNRLSNLEWVTPKENSEHASRLGLYRSGEENNLSVLNEKRVVEIKRMIMQNIKVNKISKKYNVSTGVIYHIKCGISWREVIKQEFEASGFGLAYVRRQQSKKLDNRQVKMIKKDIKNGLKGVEIAKKYDISRYVVGSIINGKTYQHVK